MKRFVNSISFVVCLLLLFSCEIGLGSAVDTEPPSIDITTPESDAVIRDAFKIGGTWSDDGSISSLTVSLARTDGYGEYGPFEGTMVESEDENVANTWSCIISPRDANFNIIDGSYVATISITDEAEHTTTQTRQFTIDNTAPVVVLQRPSSKVSESTPDSYGQTFTLEGQAADDNNINLIRVYIYSDAECTQLVHYVDLKNVPPTISLDVAKFVEGDTSNDYYKIYGSATKNGTKDLYCKIVAYDGAQRYPVEGNQSADDTRGNSTSTYYLYEDISSSVLSSNKITEVYHMMNGTYLLGSTSRSEETVNNVVKALSSNVISSGKFSLNPANNPTFTVSGRSLLKNDGSDFSDSNYSISNGNSVVIDVAPGLDGIYINDNDNFKVYVQSCDYNGNSIGEAPIYPSDDKILKSGTSYKFVVPVSTSLGFVIGQNYIFGVDGTDENGNGVIANDSGYGFHLASSGAAPTLTVTSPAQTISYLKKGLSEVIKGTIISEDGIPTLTILNGDTPVEVPITEGTKISSGIQYLFEYPLDFSTVTNSCQNSYTIRATQEGLNTTVNRTIIYDVDGPTINIESMQPTASKYIDDESGDTDGKSYLNGDVTLKLSIIDDYDTVDTTTNKPYFIIFDASDASCTPIPFRVDSEATAQAIHYITTPAKQNFVIHTTDIDNTLTGKDIKIRIFAWDRAGNSYLNGGKEYLEAEYTVNQSTDKPVILPYTSSSVSLKYSTQAARDSAGKSSFASSGQLQLRLIDDDGIKHVKIERANWQSGDTAGEYKTIDDEEYTNFSTDLMYPHQLPSNAGYYWIKVTVTDKNGLETVSGPFIVRVTAAAPSLLSVSAITEDASDSAVGKYISTSGTKTKFKNKLEISGTESPFYIYRTEKINDNTVVSVPATKPATEAAIESSANYVGKTNSTDFYDTSIDNTKQTENKTWIYIVVDNNWNSSNQKEITCEVDNKKPDSTYTGNVITAPAAVASGNATAINGDNYYLSGNAYDADATTNTSKSGIAKVLYAITNSSTNITDSSLWNEFTANEGKWNLNIELGTGSGTNTATKLYEGHYYLHAVYVDGAGNKSNEITPREFYVDQSAPTTTVTGVDDRSYVNATFTISGVASDTYGVAKVDISFKNLADNSTTTYSSSTGDVTFASATGNWSKTVTLLNGKSGNGNTIADGKYTATVTVTDNSGKTYSDSRTVTIDTTNPSGAFNKSNFNPQSSYTNTSVTPNTDWYKNNSIKFNVSVTEANIDTVEATLDTDYTNSSNYQMFNKVSGIDGQYQGSMSLSEGKNTVAVKMTDLAGNKAYVTTDVYVDTVVPVFSVTSTILQYVPNEGFEISGTATDEKVSGVTYGPLTLTVKEEHKAVGGTYSVTANGNDKAITVGSDGNWKFRIPLHSTDPTSSVTPVEGKYKYSFTLKDAAGNSVDYPSSGSLIETTVDTIAPVLTITSPNGKVNTSAVDETNYRFEGGITEANSVTAVYYQILEGKSPTAPAQVANGQNTIITDSSDANYKWTSWTAGNKGTTNWNFYKSFKSGATSGTTLGEGSYTVYVSAVDGAGNVATNVSNQFDVDMSAPSVNTYADSTELTDNTKVTKTSAYTFKFKVSDTKALDSTSPYTVIVKKDGVALTDVTSSGTDGYKVTAGTGTDAGYYIVSIEGTAAGDALYEYTITAKDWVGKTTTVVRNVQLDTTPPVITIVSPSLADYQSTGSVTVNGSAGDASGVSKVYYQFAPASAPTTTTNQTDFTGWSEVTSGTTSWKITGLTGDDGNAKSLYICAVDTNGLVSAVSPYTVKYDLNNPTLTAVVKKTSDTTGTGASSLNTNESFTISGITTDANGIKSLEVSDGQNTYTTTSTPAITLNDNGTYSLPFTITKDSRTAGKKTGELDDGNYTFTVTTTDNADKVTTKQLTVLVDTINPSPSASLDWRKYQTPAPDAGVPYKVNKTDMTVTVTETNLETVYYYVNDGSVNEKTTSSVTDAEWNVISGTKAIALNDGNGAIWVKAVDKAGNVGYDTSKTYNVDTQAPDTVTLGTVDGQTLSGNKLISGKKSVVFTVTAKDYDNGYTSGVVNGDKADRVASVNLSYLGNAAFTETQTEPAKQVTATQDATSGVWTITIPAAQFSGLSSGTLKIKVKATDKAGNTKEYEMFNMELDNTAPAATISTPTASTINGTQTITGSVTDKNPKAITLYYMTGVPASTTTIGADSAATGWKLYKKITTDAAPDTPDSNTTYGADVSSIYYWSFSDIDMNTLSTAKTSADTGYSHDIYWLAYAEDSAGNVTEIADPYYTKKYSVDMDADRPVIQVMNNVTLKNSTYDMSATYRAGITSQTMTINVSDDDGISKVEYKIDSVSLDDSTTTTQKDWTEASLSGSSYQIPLASDGKKNVYLRVTDSANSVFTTETPTGKTETTYRLDSPKITDGTNQYGYFDATATTAAAKATTKSPIIYAKVDTQAPLVQPVEFKLTDSSGAYTSSTWSSSLVSTSFGGTKNRYLKLRQFAYDVNGISSATLTVDGVTTSITFTATSPAVTEDKDVNGTTYTFTEYVSENIDVSTWSSGTKSGTLAVSDGVNTRSTAMVLVVDNDAPTVSITSPAETDDPVYGSVVVRGSSEAGATLSYTLSLDGTNAPSTTAGKTISKWNGYKVDENGIKTLDITDEAVTSNVAVTDYVEFDSDKGLSWTIYFDGGAASATATHLQQLINYITDFNVTTTAEINDSTNPFSSIVYMYLWIKAEDDVGNSVEKPFLIKLDPQGGRPTVSIDYPESEAADNKIDSFGGSFKVYGSAEDLEEGVQSVWLQILSNKHRKESGGTFNEELDTTSTFGTYEPTTTTNNAVTSMTITPADLNYWKAAGYTVKKMKTEAVWEGTLGTGETAAEYGIKADLTGSTWRLKLNDKSEFSPVGTGNTATLAMRVYAYDGGKLSYPRTKKFEIDNDKPYINNVKLRKYDGSGNVIGKKDYTAGVCVKGSWSLLFTANDNSKVDKVTYKIGSGVSQIATKLSGGTDTDTAQDYKIDLDTGVANSVGSIEITITVSDSNSPANEKEETYTIKYDNKAPKIANYNNANYALKPKVQQSNGFYTMKSFVSDAETGANPSGIDSVAFYFLRRSSDGASGNIYDPMLVRPTTAAAGLVGTSDTNVEYSEGLYWKKATGSVSGSVLTISSADPNIHAGGLCKIDGTHYLVTKVEETKITLNGEPDATANSSISASFAVAMIVDNTVAEFADGSKSSDGYYTKPGNDDGDRMIEYVDGTSVEATWEAQIVSRNIPDGPIEIHYVAFDKAGNYSIGIVGNKPWATYQAYTSADAEEVKNNSISGNSSATFVYAYDSSNVAYVSNNAPRIVSVTVGTDFNGDNSIKSADGETITKYYSASEGKPIDAASTFISSSNVSDPKNGNGIFTLKNYSEIRPEIIGGNGQLYYEYHIASPTGASKAYMTAAEITASATSTWVKSATLADNILKDTTGTAISGTLAMDEETYLDSSNGYIKDALKKTGVVPFTAASLQILNSSEKTNPSWFTIRIWDSTDGTTPFTDSQDAILQVALANLTKDSKPPRASINPFYWTSQTDNSLYNNSYKNGHIDLSKDLVEAAGSTWAENTYVDPKVSGKITFRGTVFDDHDIAEIWAKFGDIACDNAVNSKAAESGYYLVAKKTNGVWSKSGDGTTAPSSKKWNFNITGTESSEDGLLVSWQLDIDTSDLSTGYALNQKLELKVKDAVWASSSDDSLHQSALTDIQKPANDTGTVCSGFKDYSAKEYNVPYYQVDVVPYISGIKDSSGSDASRSRLGRYPVKVGDSIIVEGFNFGTTAPTVYRSKTSNGKANETSTDSTITASSPSTTSFTITAPANSGYIRAVWGTGDSAVSTPNNTNTNKRYNISEGLVLSDDDSGYAKANAAGTNFWSDDVYLSVWKTGGTVTDSTNPFSGTIKKIDSNSDTIWKRTNSNELNMYTSETDRLLSAWGADDLMTHDFIQGASWTGAGINNATKAQATYYTISDEMDFITIDGMPWYVILDESITGESANKWGLGLFLSREGFKFDKSNANNISKVMTIELLGNQQVDTSRANLKTNGYTDGVEEISHQFRNPKITGYRDTDTFYLYTCYYDNYAHCLKYAAFKETLSGYNSYTTSKAKDSGKNAWMIDGGDGWSGKLTPIMRTASGHETDSACVVAGQDTTAQTPSFSGVEEAGEWSDIVINKTTHIPYIIYYSATDRCVKIAWPSSKITDTSSAPDSASDWNKMSIKPSGTTDFGRYLSAQIDSSGNIYIAAQDTGTENSLWYAYLPSTLISVSSSVTGTAAQTTSGFVADKIDGTSSVGHWTDIELTDSSKTGYTAEPVISYIDSSKSDTTPMKVAYVVSEEWDAQTVPTDVVAKDQKTNALADCYEFDTSQKAGVAVGYTANMLCVDFLRDEQ